MSATMCAGKGTPRRGGSSDGFLGGSETEGSPTGMAKADEVCSFSLSVSLAGGRSVGGRTSWLKSKSSETVSVSSRIQRGNK